MSIIQIMKTSILLAILVISCLSVNNLKLQYGTYIARSSSGTGSFDIRCSGGSGTYDFSYNNLPQGWRNSGSTLLIPNIGSLFGKSYMINVQIRDKISNNILNGNIVLVVNGVRIDISSAGPNSIVLIDGVTSAAAGNVVSGGSSTSRNVVSSSSSITTSSSSSQISSLYNSYPGLPLNTNTLGTPSNIYSSPAGLPSSPNPAPIIIANAQAAYNPTRDANTITIDEVKRTAIFNRQINANKAIANLVSIVQRLTANVNAAQSDILTLEAILRNTQNVNNACEEQIYNFANTRAKIQNAIADKQNSILVANGAIQQVDAELKTLQTKFNSLVAQRSAAETQRSPNAAKLKSLEADLDNCQSQIDAAAAELTSINNKIADLSNDVRDTKESASSAPARIAQINVQEPIVDRKIADLKRQLADAESQKSQLGKDRIMYQNQIDQAQIKVKTLQRQISTQKAKIPNVQSKIQSLSRNCERIQKQLDTFRINLAQIQSSYSALLQQINSQQTIISSKETQMKNLQNSVGDLPNQIKLLRAELSRVDSALRRQNFICEAAADDVRAALQNLEAMRVKLQRERDFLQQANINLQKARAEKELADAAVQEVLQTYTSALPFSITPNGLGATYAGTPAGNNPSGSPLGPVATSNSAYQYDSVMIGDLNTYLSSAYRAGVDPARSETVTSLYPLSTTTLSTLVNQSNTGLVNRNPSYSVPSGNLYNFQCNNPGTQVTGSGTIYSVQPGMIQVNTNNGLTNLRLSGCSNLESIRQNQILGQNDNIYFRGYSAGGSTINLQSLTCV